MIVRRGDIFYADLGPTLGSEQSGVRPIVIVQNNTGNKHSPTTICVSITSKSKNCLPTHQILKKGKYNIQKDSIIMYEQVRTIDKRRLKEKLGHLDDRDTIEMNEKLQISFGI